MNKRVIQILVLILLIVFVWGLCFFIGFDFSIRTLLIIIGIDFLTGLALAVAGSAKHGDGKLSSKVGFRGIIKKITILMLVGLGAMLDDFLLTRGYSFDHIKEIVIVAFIINESISIVENARLVGLPIPDVFSKLLNILSDFKTKNKK